MRILVDADGCPVVDLSIQIAKEYELEIIIVKNYAHIIEDSYATIVTVDISNDSADYYIANHSQKDDIIVTQDYGLAAMSIAKGAICINQYGLIISSDNIDSLLNRRHINQKMRREQNKYTKFKKRDQAADLKFENNLRNLLSRTK